jgi:creatinine amidohydrolase
MTSKPILWDELTWTEIEELTKKVPMAILPVGATEQHGPHLPLSTDTLQVYEVAKRASALTGVPVLPPLAIGLSQSHGKFPGTVWVRSETMIRFLTEICHSLYQSGIRKFFLLNGHMYNLWVLQCVRDNLRCDFDDLQCTAVNYFLTAETRFAEDAPMRKHIHGNYGETCQVLAIRPDLVQMDQAVNEDDFYTMFDHRFDQISRSGVIGRNASGATAEEGAKMLEAFGLAVADLVQKGLQEPIRFPGGYEGRHEWTKPAAE